MYHINFSKPSVITSSENSTEIDLMIVLLIVFICTEKTKRLSYKKLSYIYSRLNSNKHSDVEMKEFLSPWNVEDLRRIIIHGANNKLWDIEVVTGKIAIIKNDNTREIYQSVVADDEFSFTRERINDLSKVSDAKLNRYKLAW
ncbi:hypothetical protein AB4455_14595 [Vibrio sp. 10N.261.46.E12]|uniref:hypothetical protein n=2 Tax=Vibrio TaxID=662 RepID=UPI00097807C9|nr:MULTISPECIES: hypothetical protein [unclassified Vibrio]OMO37257.1 hypothetical protein BH584_23705 [Vibrio sp. 10N.261.45.E1]PMJ20581.1 hypothetical protein BCU27_19720 [Vibrio sp. 10N.286.45.B6]PML83415.1 hypothetical protein BCT66_18940 [Vibrio sp. 10N.261.49.E11]PMM78554.1 hypothetical protein BCT48_22525 [Vibrio sp. 10N.261.46.F12]PMM89577.1 hypothetical protein BCT46_04105 [Vibrio sp. 10N.261.46.E8]